MKKQLSGFIIVFFVIAGSISLSCQKSTLRDKSDILQHAVIWRISGNGLASPSFLFGTIHLLDSTDIHIAETVIEQFKKVDAVVFETDLTDPSYQENILASAMMENDSLDGVLSESEYDDVASFFLTEFGFPLDQIKRMKPFYVASVIDALNRTPASSSYEEVLIKMARKMNKEIAGIATVQDEAAILSKMKIQDQVAYLKQAIKDYESGESETTKKEILQAYNEGDLEKVLSIMQASLMNNPDLAKVLFDERNEHWVSRIGQLMREKQCFFAVGVGHLPGEKGLIALLRNEGYTVRPVHMDFKLHD